MVISKNCTDVGDVCVRVCLYTCARHVGLFPIPWTVACQAPLFMGFFRQEYWSGLPCLAPGDLPNPGLPTALQVDSSMSEPPGKPKNTGVGSHSLLQGIFLAQISNLHYRQILYQLSYQGKPKSVSINGIVSDPDQRP